MTKEDLYAKYEEQVKAKAAEAIEKSLSDVKAIMPKDEYDEAYAELYNVFITGANTARDILVELFTKYAKELSIKEMEKKI